MEVYSLTKEDMEENADILKMAILSALVKENLLTKEKANEWCEKHTIIMRKKSFFRTLSDKFKKEKKENNNLYIVVKLI